MSKFYPSKALFNDNERRQWLEDEHAKEISILTSQEEALQEKIRELENGAEKVKSEKDAEVEKIKGEANMIIKGRVSVIFQQVD